MISVVIPVYKVEPYIEKCIRSVIAQTFTEWELILVDDGSPDRCGEICDRFAQADARIRVIHQKNAGLSAARNAGMKTVQGDCVTFIDSDDSIDPEHLQTLWNSMVQNDSDIAIAGYREVDENDLQLISEPAIGSRSVCLGKYACRRLMETEDTMLITAWGKLYRRNLFSLIHYPEGRLNEDEYVTYRLLYESERVSFTGMNSYVYLKRGGSITSSITARHLKAVDAFRGAVEFFSEKNDEEMRVLAEKRLLRMIRSLYLKGGSLSDKECRGLLMEWNSSYRKYHREISDISSFTERMANLLFYVSPPLYSALRKL